MTTFSDYPVNPMATSFQELIDLLPSTLGKTVPQAQECEADKDKILFLYETGNAVITVYRNGFCLYQDEENALVFAVDRCRNIHYRDHDGNLINVPRGEFAPGPCLIPLLMTGDSQNLHDADEYDFYWLSFMES